MPKFILSKKAEMDLDRIWHYVGERTTYESADRILNELTAAIRAALSLHPRAGRLREEFGAGVRSHPIPPYVVFYRGARTIRILRVLHGHREIHPPLFSLLIKGNDPLTLRAG